MAAGLDIKHRRCLLAHLLNSLTQTGSFDYSHLQSLENTLNKVVAKSEVNLNPQGLTNLFQKRIRKLLIRLEAFRGPFSIMVHVGR